LANTISDFLLKNKFGFRFKADAGLRLIVVWAIEAAEIKVDSHAISSFGLLYTQQLCQLEVKSKCKDKENGDSSR
jgi:hypothetical protein